MKEEDIRKYSSLMKELELTGLEIEADGEKVRIERGVAASVVQPVQVPVAPERKAEPAEEAGEALTSPMVGVFYTSPAEDCEPFVKVGDRVRTGDTVCIIEAMKLMNEIKAECDGTIVKVSASNGQVVGFGTELFRIRRA